MAIWTVDAQVAVTVQADNEEDAIKAAVEAIEAVIVGNELGVYVSFDDVVAFDEDEGV